MITHICKIHGALEPDNFIKKGKNTSGSQAYRCKFCMKEIHAKNYLKNKEKIDERNRLYRQKNRELVREMNKNYYHATKTINSKNKRIRDQKLNRKQINNLSDRYIKKLLTKNGKFTYDQLNSELIESKRKELIDKRKIRNE